MSEGLRAFVVGRVGADLPPRETNRPLSRVSGFGRAVGGFGGNVSTGLARLGVATALLAAVGEDGHGEFIRDFLTRQGVDVRWLRTVPGARTPLAFFEVWPPDHFPATFYPSSTYWAVGPEDVPWQEVSGVDLVAVSGTVMANQPSRSAMHGILAARPRASRSRPQWNVLDLDWRPTLWLSRRRYAKEMARIARHFDVVIGGEAEFEATGLTPEGLRTAGVDCVVTRLGPGGVAVSWAAERVRIPGIEVETVSGMGSSEAFVAAFGAALLEGLSPLVAARRGNAAGAIVATRLDCSTAMPTRAEVDDLLAATGQERG